MMSPFKALALSILVSYSISDHAVSSLVMNSSGLEEVYNKPLSSFESDTDFLKLEHDFYSSHSSDKLHDIGQFFEDLRYYDQAALYYTLSCRKGNHLLRSYVLKLLNPTSEEANFYLGEIDINFKNNLTIFSKKLKDSV